LVATPHQLTSASPLDPKMRPGSLPCRCVLAAAARCYSSRPSCLRWIPLQAPTIEQTQWAIGGIGDVGMAAERI
jgi:hypothetical protein